MRVEERQLQRVELAPSVRGGRGYRRRRAPRRARPPRAPRRRRRSPATAFAVVVERRRRDLGVERSALFEPQRCAIGEDDPASVVAGHVAHQLTTAVRSPASAATSQKVFARRSSPLATDGRVSRIRSVAPRSLRANADGSAACRLPWTPATRRVSRAWTPWTLAGWPVAIVVQARAGSEAPGSRPSASAKRSAAPRIACRQRRNPSRGGELVEQTRVERRRSRSREGAGRSTRPSAAAARRRVRRASTLSAAAPRRRRRPRRPAIEARHEARGRGLASAGGRHDHRRRHDRYRVAEQQADRDGDGERGRVQNGAAQPTSATTARHQSVR